MSILDNYKRIREQIDQTAIKIGRSPDDIKIISVSKTFPNICIQEAINSGIYIFGESKIQEAKIKIPLLHGKFLFHMIGHLQSNKSKDAVNLFDLIHSIDKIDTAIKLNAEAAKINKTQKILIQIKTSDEITKSGIIPDRALELASKITELENLKLEGVMSIGPLTDDIKKTINSFRETTSALSNINRELSLNLKEISMGMSGDYLAAVEEGSTIVRIGTAIFGNRS